MVVAFEEERGLGTVRDEGGAEHPFHCTAIADGSREIEVGRAVEFDLRPGLPGRYEAQGITKR